MIKAIVDDHVITIGDGGDYETAADFILNRFLTSKKFEREIEQSKTDFLKDVFESYSDELDDYFKDVIIDCYDGEYEDD